MKIEKDSVRILGGVMAGRTTGGPIAFLVDNLDHRKWKGKAVDPMTAPRPGHADLTGAVKYGFDDLRPSLERASARETTMRVAVGAVCKHFLAQFGILIGGFVRSQTRQPRRKSGRALRKSFTARTPWAGSSSWPP